LPRCRSRAADVRRTDRLSHVAHGGRRASPRDLRLWRRRAHRRPGGAPSGPPALRLHPPRRRGSAGFCALARRGMGRRLDCPPPEPLDAALIFAPVGSLVPAALAATKKGGTVVCGGIHMSDIPSFPYRILWEERV